MQLADKMSTIDIEFYPSIPEELQDAELELKKNAKNWDKPFFFEPRKCFDMAAIKKVCDPIIAKGIEHVIVIGTGGSIQTMLALLPFCERKVHPITCSRPTELKDLLKIPGIKEKSIVIPISRGGETLDINSVLFLFARFKMLGLNSKGAMNGILKTFNAPIMDVPDLSGRFAGSCTNVALVPAYLAGLNIDVFISGLEEGYDLYRQGMPLSANPAKKFAYYLYRLYKNGCCNVFNMPYSSWLEGAVGLWVQELSESTGKNGLGLLGTSQSAPVCQHSVLEYLLGGPKYHTLPMLWTINKDPHDMPLNSAIPNVQDKTAAQTILYQANATFEALLTKGLPAAMLSIDIPTIKNIGHLIAFIQSTVYYTCLFFNVNWSDNPNVALGKEICNEAMTEKKSWSELQEKRKNIAQGQFENFWVL
jgi:glucose-6-phosphate isomerase